MWHDNNDNIICHDNNNPVSNSSQQMDTSEYLLIPINHDYFNGSILIPTNINHYHVVQYFNIDMTTSYVFTTTTNNNNYDDDDDDDDNDDDETKDEAIDDMPGLIDI
jgi:hypothetical protein